MATFCDTLRERYQTSPDQVAIQVLLTGREDTALTYRDLLRGAAGYAATLEARGVQPGDVVILIFQHSFELIYAYWGCILRGAIPSIMPFLTEKLLPERYRGDLAALVSVTRPQAIFTYREFEGEVGAVAGADTSVQAVIFADEALPPRDPNFESMGGCHRVETDIVLLQHSSGTTGLQKGVALSHQAVHNQLEHYRKELSIDQKDVIVSWLPLYHDMGLIACFLMPILLGVPLVLLSPFEWVRAPHRLMQAVSKYKGTLSWLPNFAYNFCAQKVRDRDLEGVDLSSWRAISNCSEPMRHESHEALYEKFRQYGLRREALCTCYAMAENVFAVTQGGIKSPVAVDEIDREAMQTAWRAEPAREGYPSVKMPSAGLPIEGTEVKVVDESGVEVGERVIAELALRSDCMLSEYYNRPEVTSKAIRDGWFFTGDYGYMVGGEVYVCGRKKELIIVGGKNVYPMDLEELAMTVGGVHPGRVSAFGIFNESSGTEDVVIVAEVETEDPAERLRIGDEIRAAVTRGSAVALRQVYLVGPRWLVKTSSGKNARVLNKEKYLKETGQA